MGYVGTLTDITERKKAEELLVAKEKRFRKLIENANDAFAIVDARGKPSYVSSSVKRVLGYTEEEVYQMNMMDIVHPDNLEEVHKTLQKAFENPGVPITSHLSRLLHKDGTYHWFEDTITNLIDDPDIGGIVDNFRDVTERVNSQDALIQSEEKHRDIVENITDILCTHDLQGNVLSVNATAKKSLGYEIEEMLKMKIQDVLTPHSQARFADYINSMKQNGFAQGLMYLQTRSGESRIWEFRNKLRNIEGKQPFIYGFAHDVTERIQAEEKLRSKNAQLQTLSDNLPGVMIYQLQGKRDGLKKFTYVSNGVLPIAGKTPEEVMEDPSILYETIFEEDIRRLIEAEHRSLIDMSVLNIEVRCRTYKDDVRWLNIVSTPRIMDNGQVVWDGFHLDITERKKSEQALQASEEKYRSLIEQASDAIFIADTGGKFITVNPSACKLSGYTEAELMQMTIHEFTVEEDVRRLPFRFDDLKQGLTTLTERVMKVKDGSRVHVEITSKLLSDGRLLSFVRNIEERIRAQNEIIKEKNLSDSIINSLPASFFMINGQGKILRWNKHLERASKYNGEEIAQMNPFDFFAADQKSLLVEKIGNVFVAGEDSMEAVAQLKTGEPVPYYFKGIAIEYDGMPCIMGVGIDISERVKAQEEIKLTSEKLRELTNHLLNIREEERKRIGREIHDELGQQLTAIKMDVSWIDKKIADESTLIKNKLKNIITLLDGSNQSIRRILSELRPGILDDNGLLEALEWLNRQFTAQTGVPVEFETKETELKLPEQISTCIFRVYQETFTNITRYAQASKVIASLVMGTGTITITVQDNGNGFDAKSVQGKKSFGILGMKERILALNGNFQLISQQGAGTKIIMSLPLFVKK